MQRMRTIQHQLGITEKDFGDPQQQSWVPYGPPTEDCSEGFCSIYCPQWCYIVFPPPPPLDTSPSPSPSSSSPLVIAFVGILASVFLLAAYYTIISKYCSNPNSHTRTRTANGDLEEAASPDGQQRDDPWHAPAPGAGLDEAAIRSITKYRYRRGDGLVSCADCSVCLSEFAEEEVVRLLPKCGHAFHVSCIDTWLGSHPNCPLCRAHVAPPPTPASAAVVALPPQPPPPPPEEIVPVDVEAQERRSTGGRESDDVVAAEAAGHDAKDPRAVVAVRVSVADVLEMEEDGAVEAVVEGSSSASSTATVERENYRRRRRSRYRCRGSCSRWRETGALHCVVMGPVVMKKRSWSPPGRLMQQRVGITYNNYRRGWYNEVD